MKLRDEAMHAYKKAIAMQNDTAFKLGMLELEYEAARRKFLSTAAWWSERQSAATVAGLLDLGLPAHDKKRHFHVDAEGQVFEIVDGKQIEPVVGEK